MLPPFLRSLLLYAVDRKPGAGPNVAQRLIVAAAVTFISGTLPFVYSIFVAAGILLLDIGLFGADAGETAVACLMVGAVIALLIGLRSAVDYWRNWDLPD